MAYPRNTNLSSQFPNINTEGMHTLMECMGKCKACAKKCIEEGLKNTAILCGDCADVCDLAIKFKSSDSEYAQQVMQLCSNVCRHCASECSHTQTQHCQECAETCRRCAEACSVG